MAHIVVMPKLGLTMTEGIITKWYINEGEKVKEGDALFEVTTDKLTNEVQADAGGILRKQLAAEGEAVPCTDPVAIIAEENEDLTSLLYDIGTSEQFEQKVTEKKSQTQKNSEKVISESTGYKASPAAKKLAAENTVDLHLIKGTGPQGRIVYKDIEEYLENRKVKASPTAVRAAEDLGISLKDINKNGRIMKDDVLAFGYHGLSFGRAEKEEKRIPLSNLRKVIAKRMSESWSISPMVTYNLPVDITQLRAFKDSLKDTFEKAGMKLTYNHLVMKICAKVLIETPYVNGTIDGDELILHDYVNIGLAVSVDNGLLVPNVKNVEAKPLLAIAEETERLIGEARSNKLLPDDMSFGTFTISNVGMYGIESFTPIINQPELAILGIAAIVDTPVAINGKIEIKPMMNLSLTADHRVVDGAEASKFMKRIKEIIENPFLLLL